MCKLVVRSGFYEVKCPHPSSQKCSFFHHAVVQNWSKTQISPMLFSWEHQKYQNIHPGAHFGTSLGGSWGGRRVPPCSCSPIDYMYLFPGWHLPTWEDRGWYHRMDMGQIHEQHGRGEKPGDAALLPNGQGIYAHTEDDICYFSALSVCNNASNSELYQNS